MNFVRFPANTTNIFPIANSKTGGQLLTEFNLRSRESVPTYQDVNYMIGPSFCHSMNDFKVRPLQDEEGKTISTTALQITSGRALVNGHFIETFVDVSVDLAEANKELQSQDMPKLEGHLAVGLRAMYSTEQTLAASMRIENKQNLMAGIQIVILPFPEGKGDIKHGYFVLPEDTPDQEELVSAHLLLADFWYQSGKINTINQNLKKVQYLEASRLANLEGILDTDYVSLRLLNPHKLYTFSGKGKSDDEITKSTWCDSTDSLFVWQRPETIKTTKTKQTLPEARFGINVDDPKNKDVIELQLPHKQIDGMRNSEGNLIYFKDHSIPLPKADYLKGTPGTVSSEYTKAIHNIHTQISRFYQFTSGKMRAYIPMLTDRTDVTTKLNSSWSTGDYILVGQDQTFGPTEGLTTSSAPATMYVVVPPFVEEVEFLTFGYGKPQEYVTDGFEIARIPIAWGSLGQDVDDPTAANIEKALIDSKYIDGDSAQSNKSAYNVYLNIKDESGVPTKYYRGTYQRSAMDAAIAFAQTPTAKTDIVLEGDQYTQQDYMIVEITDVPQTDGSTTTIYITYQVTKTVDSSTTFSDPILLTGAIPLAEESLVGGFLNVPFDSYDRGYVHRDDEGHLVLLDYDLLRMGVYAYRLGEDQDLGEGLGGAELQDLLDEYVNERVAFPTENQIKTSTEQLAKEYSDRLSTNEIIVYLNLSEESEPTSIDVRNIDSRWGTFVTLNLSGKCDKNTTINIVNCEKIRITMNDMDYSENEKNSGYGPVINIYNSCVYYDADIIQYVRGCSRDYVQNQTTNAPVYPSGFTGIENMSIWYEKFNYSDPNLVVNGLTISEIDTPVVPEDFDDVWSQSVDNDFHFWVGLQAVTFNPKGDIIECSMYIRNDTTANLSNQRSIIALPFKLPAGSRFTYPENSLTRQIKITGQFVTSYPVANPDGYQIVDTKFTALTQATVKDETTGNYETQAGTMSFLVDTDTTTNYLQVGEFENGIPIDGWEPASYHVFHGWVIG